MARRIKKQYTGGFIDRTLTPRSVDLLSDLPPALDYAVEIGELVGRYRFDKQVGATQSSAEEMTRHLSRTKDVIEELEEHLNLLPEEFKALADYDLYRTKTNSIHEINQRLMNDLALYKILCTSAAKTMSDWSPPNKGNSKKHLEHKLLSDVAKLLEANAGLKKTAAAALASDVLRQSKVPNMPDDPKKAREAAKRYE